jgi:hypothetical protein
VADCDEDEGGGCCLYYLGIVFFEVGSDVHTANR